jgi:ATP-binding cassette subfamily C protein CydD
MRLDIRLLRRIHGIRAALAVTIAVSGALAGLIVLQAYLLSRVINSVFLESGGIRQVSLLLLVALLVIFARFALTWIGEISAYRISARARTQLREQVYAHLLALGPTYAGNERSGELIATLVEGIESLDAYFSQYLPQLFLTALAPLLVLAVVFPVDPLSGVVLLVTAPLLPLFMYLIGKMASALAERRWRALGMMSAHFLDVLQGLTTLKLLGRSKAQAETIGRISDQFRHVTLRVLRVAFLSSLVLELGATLSTAIIAVEVGLRLLYGQIAFQPAFFVLLLAPEFYLPLRALGMRYHAAISARMASQRILEILEMPLPADKNAQSASTRPTAPLALRFEDMSFAYEGERPALNGVSFEIAAGRKVALVGPSGAGKSTIARLLLRFIEPQEGRILVNGQLLVNIPAEVWRRQVAWVPQHPYLFNASIADNIRIGKPDATMAEVVEAAQTALAHGFISSLPQGYDTPVGERGARLSGGQAQRISLARAFLKDAPLLVLDEATSNLDEETEALLLEALQRLMQGRTTLIIAHHLATVFKADQIIVLQAGRIIEQGTHDALLDQPGLYKELVHAYQAYQAQDAEGIGV